MANVNDIAEVVEGFSSSTAVTPSEIQNIEISRDFCLSIPRSIPVTFTVQKQANVSYTLFRPQKRHLDAQNNNRSKKAKLGEHNKHHCILSDIKPLGQQLGCGRFGRVFEVKHRDTVCAAKEFHIFQHIKQEERQKLKDMFIEECRHCANLTHPNIVQFLGIYYPYQCSFPVMVMELMDVTLATYLEKFNSNTDLSKEASILHDIATGLNFFHTRSPPIVHRDLSSNNVLLKFSGEGMLPIAKIANLGVAKVVKSNVIAQITQCQPTIFMAPEALMHPQKDSTSIDVFSIGCVSLHILSHELPIPMVLTKRKKVHHKKLIKENSRQIYLDMITGEAAILKPMIEACLHEDPECRPSVTLFLENIKLLMSNQTISKSLNEGRKRNIDALLCEAELFLYQRKNKELTPALNQFEKAGDDAVYKEDSGKSCEHWNIDHVSITTTTTLNIVVVGDACVGKSSLLKRSINNYSMNVGCSNVTYDVHFWEMKDLEKFQELTKDFYQDIGGVFVVYNLPARRISLQHCIQWKKDISKTLQLSDGHSMPFILVGNKDKQSKKLDVVQFNKEHGFAGYFETPADKQFRKPDVVQFSKEHGFAGYFEVSAKIGTGITEALQFLVHQKQSAADETK